jgi:plastocyanin
LIRRCILLLCIAAPATFGWGQGVNVSLKINVVDNLKAGKSAASAEVVAWLTPVGGSIASPAQTQGYRLVQKNKQFTPHLLVVPTGSSIDFPNQDPFFHNVFSLFNGKRFDLGLYEAGSHRSVRFDRAGVSYIFCNIHPEMGAVVVSLSTPYYAVSSSDGSLTIAHVPSGDYELKLWSEGVTPADLSAAARRVTVSNADVQMPIVLVGRSAGVTAHKNKFGEDYKTPIDKPY